MRILYDFMKECRAEAILDKEKEDYLEFAEELFEIIEEEDALKPAAVYKEAKVTKCGEDTVWINDIPLKNSILPKLVSVGESAYICITSVGPELNSCISNLDDVLLQYFGNSLMQRCLDDGLVSIVRDILANEEEKDRKEHFVQVIPGIQGYCEADQLSNILKMFPEGIDKAKITVREDGVILPLYSNVCILYAGDGESNIPSLTADEAQRSEFIRALNKSAGHV